MNRAHFVRATTETKLLIPFFQSLIQAGFPSPAENYVERVYHLNKVCITNINDTYFARMTNDSVNGDWIEPSDILIVDYSRKREWQSSGRVVHKLPA